MVQSALAFLALVLMTGVTLAQDKGTLEPKELPPITNPHDPKIAAKDLFGRKPIPFPGPAHSIGFYSHGCLAGAAPLPTDGATWQVMRLSRNRNWGHPKLIALLERLSKKVSQVSDWPGLLVGDMSQPRGGPMLTGHASHQIGLDADIWLTPMPKRTLTRVEREEMSATMVVADNRREVDPKVWTPGHLATLRAAAEEPQVERIFVNAAIKKKLCEDARGPRAWLSKIRPWWGHDYHFHIRMFCPEGQADCKGQEPPGAGDGCGHELDYWFKDSVLFPVQPLIPPKPRPPMTLAALPKACANIVFAP